MNAETGSERVGPRFLPSETAARARAFVAGGLPPVTARPAATVVLLRDYAGRPGAGLEVYVHRRHAAMPFAAGMLAFPGGRVDPVDLVGDTAPPRWAATLDQDPRAAAGIVRAAVRETHEETGLVLGPECLVPWAHWITPRYEQRRYDTWFFLATVPDGQQPRNVSGEVEDVAWLRPAVALDRARRGAAVMLPPTYAVLDELAGYPSVEAVLTAAANRGVEPILPGWVDDGDRVQAVLPGDDGYPGDDAGEDAGSGA